MSRKRCATKRSIGYVDFGVAERFPRVFRLTWAELATWLGHANRGMYALDTAELIATHQEEELRIARNRIANAADALREARRMAGYGNTDGAWHAVAAAIDCLTAKGAE